MDPHNPLRKRGALSKLSYTTIWIVSLDVLYIRITALTYLYK